MRKRTRIALALLGIAVAGAASIVAFGHWLGRPHRLAVGPAPADLRAIDIAIPSESGSVLRGWLVPAAPRDGATRERGAILLLHGIHATRKVMVPRARFLASAGYASLLVDLQAHGESPGEQITFGLLEARDAEASLAFLRERFPDLPLGAIGVSMGGAALLLAKRPLGLSAVVLESVYPTIEQACAGRARSIAGPAGPVISSLLLVPLRWQLGLSLDQLRPIDRIATLDAPLLLLHGGADRATPLVEAEALFAAAREPKEMHVFERAAHVDLSGFAPGEYASLVLGFFAGALGSR